MGSKRRFRRLWYFRRRNLRYYRLLLCIISVLLVFILMWMYVCEKLFPVGLSGYDDKLHEAVQNTVENKITAEYGSRSRIDTILDLEKDLNDRIISAKADNIKLNILSLTIERELNDQLIHNRGEQYTALKAPLIPVLNTEVILGGARVTKVDTAFVSKFLRGGSDSTKLFIYLNVNITYEYLLGYRNKTFEFSVLDVLLGG